MGCAMGLAISPFGALATGECNETIEKVVDKASDVASKYIPEDDVVDVLKDVIGFLSPLPTFTLGRLAGRQIGEALGLSPEAKAEYEHRLSSIENTLLFLAAPLLFPGPVLPVAVGIERYARPLLPQMSPEELGSFATDLLTSAAMIGFAGVGAKALAAGAKSATKAAVGKEALETYLEKIGGPASLLYFNPFF